MYQAGPEVAGLSPLNETVGNEIKKALDDMRKTGIRTTQTNQSISFEKGIEKETQC
jgi:hypothetical protein